MLVKTHMTVKNLF